MSIKINKLFKTFKNPTYQVIAALLLFVISVIASRGTHITSFESHIFFWIHDLPSFLNPLFYLITQAGSIYLLALLLIFYIYKRSYPVVLRLLLTGTLAYLLAGFCKSVWGRGRPFDLLENVQVLDYFQGAGFPSGHVALATALALTTGHYLIKKNPWLPALWILGVAVSRIYLGVHLPLDIVGGFAIGWLSYALFRHVRIYDASPHKKSAIKTKIQITRRH